MREEIVRKYFNMWLSKDISEIDDIFSENIYYSECYGPEYRGLNQIKLWFNDWNKHGTVLEWNIKQFVNQDKHIATEWYFKCEYDGVTDGFDGVSIIEFNESDKIISIKEFQSKLEHYMPYE